MPRRAPRESTTGEGDAVVALECLDGFFLSLLGAEGDELAVHQALDAGVGLGHDEGAEADVIDEDAGVIDDEDDVDGLGVAAGRRMCSRARATVHSGRIRT